MANTKMSSTDVVGYEGVFGFFVLMLTFFLLSRAPPAAAGESAFSREVLRFDWDEDVGVALASSQVVILLLLGAVATCMESATNTQVIQTHGTVTQSFYAEQRTVLLFLVELFLFYVIQWHGEPWRGVSSWIQMLGMLFLSTAVVVYGNIFSADTSSLRWSHFPGETAGDAQAQPLQRT